MKVWVVSHLGTTEGTRLTTGLLNDAGVEARVVNPTQLSITLCRGQIAARHQDGLALPDLVYTRLGSSAPSWAIDVVRQLEWAGVRCVNDSRSLEACRDKLRSMQMMARDGLPIVETMVLGSRASLDRVEQTLGPPPYVLKLPISSKGTGVTVVESARSLRSTLDMLEGLGQRALVQRFVAGAGGADTRVLVLGGRAVLAVRRQARGDEFRSNVYLGGEDALASLDESVTAVAERAAALHGLSVAGVDLMQDDGEHLIAEVNGSPGLSGPHRRDAAALRNAFHQFVARLGEERDR